MIIRPLKIHELPLALEGGESFFQEGKLPGKFNGPYFLSCWTDYLKSGTGEFIGLLSDDERSLRGALGAIFYRDPFTSDLVAVEQFWYVMPDDRGDGIRLFDVFIASARERGCRRVMMIHLKGLYPDALRRLYERRGFKEIETSFVRQLQ